MLACSMTLDTSKCPRGVPICHISLLMQVLWPGSEKPIKDKDLYVGAVLPILKRSFQLLDADEFTYQYMENNRHCYPVADANSALNIVATAVKTGP